MNFELDEQQQAILGSIEKLLARAAGPFRARALAKTAEYDFDLDREVESAGFFDLTRNEGTGPLEAALVLEAIAKSPGAVAFGARALVAQAISSAPIEGPIALANAADGASVPVRYGAHAKHLLILDGDVARLRALRKGDATPVPSPYGYPIARVPKDGGDRLPSGSGERMLDWWRVALATEMSGTMKGALDFTVEYVKERKQFGRAIGSFQAIQHRLAECTALAEGSRWLALEAAHVGAPRASAAAAAAHAAAAAQRIFHETHQMNGSIGFTREHHLFVWTMRLQALRLELGGAVIHRRDLSRSVWPNR
jgi:alkylation response protein AidB-like acyl-CoA dehydrogenase